MTRPRIIFACLAVAFSLVSLSGGMAAPLVQINGAGATLPYPVYSKWFDEYHKRHSDTRINYQSIDPAPASVNRSPAPSSGATDTPMRAQQLQQAPGRILHLPMILGAVVPVYNLPTVSTPLRFSGPVLADVFLGRIAVERRRTRALESRRRASQCRHHRRPSIGGFGNHLHLGRFPVEGVGRFQSPRRGEHVGQLAGRRRCQRQ